MSKLILSIVIPFYNVDNFKYTINNLISNKSNKYEIIIVNDCSDQKYASELNKIKRKNVQIFNLPQNIGQSQARKFGFTQSIGKYLFFLDAGDKLHVNKLLSIINKWNGFDIITFDFQSRISGKIKTTRGNSLNQIINSYAGIWIRVFKRSLIKETYFLNERWFGEDVYFTLSFAQNACKFKKVNETLYIYNNMNYGITRNANDNWLTIINTCNELISNAKSKKMKKLMQKRKLIQLMAYLHTMRKLPNNKYIYNEICKELKKCTGFWRLKFKYKIYFILVRMNIHKWIYKPN